MVVLLILAKWTAQVWLERLNLHHVRAHAGAVPEAFKGVVDEATYARSVQYTLAKGRLDRIETAVMEVHVPLAFFHEAYNLKQHIEMVGGKLARLNQPHSIQHPPAAGGGQTQGIGI